MYEPLERRATMLVLASGIAVPLGARADLLALPDSNVPAILTIAAVALFAVALLLAVLALIPEERTDRLPLKAQLVFWAHVAFAAGILAVAANAAYAAYRLTTTDFGSF